jgi:succinate-semialdehyde dehydrogenase/glutarate-semialdehyde dehydrogenase
VGCTGVIRPASQTPFSAIALAVLAERAGLPPGVGNLITGPAGETGRELTSNPLVRKLTFTGSTQVGIQLLEQCAATVKKTSMELGGNAPFIVFEDADLDAAVQGAVASKFRNNGQTCVCANRLIVQNAVYDAFTAKLKAEVEKMKVGNGMDEGVTNGPLINAEALKKVEAHVADALRRGAKVAIGGERDPLGGTFYKPTILTDVPKEAEMFREETFGPVAGLFRFDTEQEAVALANDTEFGLAAYFYARDVGRIFRVAEALEYGIVGINEGIISTTVAPFGGMKASGLGREGSKYGIDEFLEIKYLAVGGIGT